jgi:hypothetical protein
MLHGFHAALCTRHETLFYQVIPALEFPFANQLVYPLYKLAVYCNAYSLFRHLPPTSVYILLDMPSPPLDDYTLRGL